MRNILSILIILLTIGGINAQCNDTGIESTYDEFDKSTKNEIKILLQNQKNEELGLDISYHSTPLTRSGKITPSISISSRLLNRGSNPTHVVDSAYLHFLFEDGTSVRLYGADHIGHIYKTMIWLKSFNEKSEERLNALNQIKTKTIKAIRFNRAYDDFDFYFSEGEKITFKKIINCITNIDYEFN
mgnify:CR=1 FL=1